MKRKIEISAYTELKALSDQELSEISGGSFWEDIARAAGYAAHVAVAFIEDNIEHPIGAAGGYPPK